MILQKLLLTNFRSYARLETDIPAGILLLSGGNAQGKTSLLESLFYCATFSPLLAQNDRQLIHFKAAQEPLAVARIVVHFNRDDKDQQIEVRIIQEPNGKNGRVRKEILLDGQKLTAQKCIGRFPAVLFIPQMTAIIEGTPQERRRYLNILLSQSVQGYAQTLSEYKQVLTQRNALLRQLAERRADAGQLAYWDEMLTTRAASLILHRMAALEALNTYAEVVHLNLTGQQEQISLDYQPSFDPAEDEPGNGNAIGERAAFTETEIQALLTQKLAAIRRNEIERGLTLIGPHRDEFRILSNGIDLGNYGSRGQIRTALLSLKFAEIQWIKAHTGTDPLLLLDETLAELDEKRRGDLMDWLDHCHQGLLTTTDLAHFSDAFVQKHTVWQVQGGGVRKD